MFWYTILIVLSTLFALALIASFALFVMSGCEGELAIIMFIALIITIASTAGADAIERANTEVETNTVQMEVVKMDIIGTDSNGNIRFWMALKTPYKMYSMKVSGEEYANLSIGDSVLIEITTETVFGEAKKPTLSLKG